MWFEILMPTMGIPWQFSGFWALDAGQLTWYKILTPIIGFSVALFFFLAIQFALHVAFKFFKRMKGEMNWENLDGVRR